MSKEYTADEHRNVIFKFIDFDDNSLPSIDTPREDIPQEILMRNTVILTQEVYEYLTRRAGLDDGTWVGHWINGDDKCPCCGKSKFEGLDADIYADWQPKYCPNCGMKMSKSESRYS